MPFARRQSLNLCHISAVTMHSHNHPFQEGPIFPTPLPVTLWTVTITDPPPTHPLQGGPFYPTPFPVTGQVSHRRKSKLTDPPPFQGGPILPFSQSQDKHPTVAYRRQATKARASPRYSMIRRQRRAAERWASLAEVAAAQQRRAWVASLALQKLLALACCRQLCRDRSSNFLPSLEPMMEV